MHSDFSCSRASQTCISHTASQVSDTHNQQAQTDDGTYSVEDSRPLVRAPQPHTTTLSDRAQHGAGRPTHLCLLRVRLHVPALRALFRSLPVRVRSESPRARCPRAARQTCSSASFASCSFVCVLPFCRSGDGNASGCERVTIAMFSYAA